MTQAILPIFKKRDEGGRGDIINIGSIAGREPYAGGSIYCATKAAVRSFTDALRKELIATRIRVIEIDPGQVETVRMPSPAFFTFQAGANSNLGVLCCAILRRQVEGRCRLQVSFPYLHRLNIPRATLTYNSQGCRASYWRRYCRGCRLRRWSSRERCHCRYPSLP